MNMFSATCLSFFILLIALNIEITLSQYNKPWGDKYENNKCPKLYPKNFVNYIPVGNLTAGNYSEKNGLKGLRQCVMACCLSDTCNIVFIVDRRCFHVECVSDELCLPLPRVGSRKWDAHVSMILVKPVLPSENWADILDQSSYNEVNTNFSPEEESLYSPYTSHRNDLMPEDDDSNFLSRFINNLPSMEEDERNFDKYRDNNDSEMIMDATSYLEKVPCEVGASDCPFNAECIPLGLKLRNGICKCIPGTEENSQGSCVQTIRPFAKGPTIPMDSIKKNDELIPDPKNDDLKTESSTPKAIQNLTVSVSDKTVQLPDNEVTLAAYTIPDEKTTSSHYNYAWTLVDQSKGGFTGNMKQDGATVKLTDLTEGQYRFKVTVNGTNSYGEGFATVTVKPPQRINTPPMVVITPQSQTVKLPNSGAVLDGSASKDDDAIISWHWDLTSGPIGYQPPLQDGPTLVLKDLKQPGNYTFRLTVEDSDHVKNFTTANITVLNHTDYPPEANAGQDVIIYLPNNKLTLNGSLSTDDHEITSWEWTKSVEDENKAVDMQNTHSPYLQLSNLSEGVYTFVLKVTDSSGQFSTADVHVFVKPPTNTPPVANAGADVTMHDLCLDVRTFREEMKKASEECKVWKAEMLELRSFMATMGDRMTQLEERIGVIEKQVSSQQADEGAIKSLETTVSQLKRDLNERDQELLFNDVDIAGIPEEEGESVQHLVLAIAAKLGVSLDERDIVSCRRVGIIRLPTEAEPRPRAITVRLARRSTRDQVFKAARVRRSLTTEGLGLRSPPRPMYINERLTRDNQFLFNKARELARKTGWRFIWTREGRVYARREHGEPARRIRCEEDLKGVFGGGPV